MSQYPITIANGTGAQVLTELDQAFIASVTNQSGSVAPTTTYAYMFWLDTSTSLPTLRMQNAANNAWISIGTIDPDLGFSPTGTAAIATIATTFGGQTASYYAPINNAALTGIPTAVTAVTVTNTTQVATCQFVQNVVNAISYAAYAPLASPVLTGVPTCPTAPTATNNLTIASTQFVRNAIAVYAANPGWTSKWAAATYTLPSQFSGITQIETELSLGSIHDYNIDIPAITSKLYTMTVNNVSGSPITINQTLFSNYVTFRQYLNGVVGVARTASSNVVLNVPWILPTGQNICQIVTSCTASTQLTTRLFGNIIDNVNVLFVS